MSYDERFAERLRSILEKRPGVEEREMFGGLAFMLKGKMFCGIIGRDLMVRVGPERYETSLRKAQVRPMDFTGRPMRGYVYVSPRGTGTKAALASWLDQAAEFVATLQNVPARTSQAKRRSR